MLTGAHRSGTTFVGKLLSANADVGYLHEPFNPDYGLASIQTPFPYIKEGTEHSKQYFELLHNYLRGRATYTRITPNNPNPLKHLYARLFRNPKAIRDRYTLLAPWISRYIIKDPFLALSTDWFQKSTGSKVIALIRHPAGFVSSIRNRKWRFDFSHLTSQPALMEDYLSDIFHRFDPSKLSYLERCALLWRCINTVLLDHANKNTNIILVRYEDVAMDPVKTLKYLYTELDMPFNSDVKKRIHEMTQSHVPAVNPDDSQAVYRNSKAQAFKWRDMLTAEEIDSIKRVAGDLSLWDSVEFDG